jgi:hypothetical protein
MNTPTINRIRNWMLRRLAGKSMVVLNARIDVTRKRALIADRPGADALITPRYTGGNAYFANCYIGGYGPGPWWKRLLRRVGGRP